MVTPEEKKKEDKRRDARVGAARRSRDGWASRREKTP
jgi:hypothetical protein